MPEFAAGGCYACTVIKTLILCWIILGIVAMPRFSVNPQDMKSAAFVKDAAGGAIWGINSGNGTMALNSKTEYSFGVLK